MLNIKEMKEKGFLKYEELEGNAKKEAHDRFAWDFVNNKWADISEAKILKMLSNHWFTKDGGTYLGTR